MRSRAPFPSVDGVHFCGCTDDEMESVELVAATRTVHIASSGIVRVCRGCKARARKRFGRLLAWSSREIDCREIRVSKSKGNGKRTKEVAFSSRGASCSTYKTAVSSRCIADGPDDDKKV